MSEPKCPRWGEPCLKHECAFWDPIPAKPGEFECRDKLHNLYLDDLINTLDVLLTSSESNRILGVEAMKSRINGGPTPELLRLSGLKEE